MILGWVIAALLVLWAIQHFARVAGRTVQTAKGRDRCAYCRTRLKRNGLTYASACRKCGRIQPWAA